MRISDWSSDVCSSDLIRAGPDWSGAALLRTASTERAPVLMTVSQRRRPEGSCNMTGRSTDRKSVVEGKSVSVRVDLGGRRIIKKKKSMEIHVWMTHETN